MNVGRSGLLRGRGLALAVAAAAAVAVGATAALVGQSANYEWTTYGGNLASQRYAPLDQINKDNFNNLEVAWRFKTDQLGPRPEYNFQGTPLEIGGVVYSTAGTRRDVVALDAKTGELLWMHGENEGERGEAAPRKLSGHGLAYWSDGRSARILYVTPGYRMIALDAKTGEKIHTFGDDGVIDLKQDDDQEIDLVHGEIGLHSTPLVVNDVIVVGAAHLAGGFVKSKNHVKGYVRGFDARTGKRLWIFHTIPRPGEFGNDTWENDSWSYTGNAGVWTQMTADPELGLVYLPVELPTGDYYGGNRPGNGLFGESLVALDVKTGQRKWHFQLVHHGLWDMDIPSAPILCDLNINGKIVKAIAQPTKQSWLYVFNRTTGQPIWPMPETPVPQSDVPGEKTSPTQPIPSKPPAYDVQGVSVDDLIDFTPELRAEAEKLVKNYKIGPLFTPPVVSQWPGPLATLHLPSSVGGANWQGGSYDPETHRLYIFSMTNVTPLGLVPADPKVSDFGYVSGRAKNPAQLSAAAGTPAAQGMPGQAGAQAGAPRRPAGGGEGGEGGGFGLTVEGLPLIKPPYGRITAFDMDKGDLLWQIAHGETPDAIKNHPKLKGLNLPRTGQVGRVGTLVTKTLVVAGDGGYSTTPEGRGAMLRAYDKATGQEVGHVFIPAPQTGSPMTYELDGVQYLVVAVSGGNYPGELIAFKVPSK